LKDAHAPLRALVQAFRAFLIEVLNVDQAALTDARTCVAVLWPYAAASAEARAPYAAFTADVYVVIPESSAASRAATAALTHAIFDEVELEAVVVEVCAKTGMASAAASPSETAPAISVFFIIRLI